MASKKLPKSVRDRIFDIVYSRADARSYSTCSRTENTDFMNSLVDDPQVGGVLREYMDQAGVRTYIKDTILNRYTKELASRRFASITAGDVIKEIYSLDSSEVCDIDLITVSRTSDGRIMIVSRGTVLKWETALRKALEYVSERIERLERVGYSIVLLLADMNEGTTFGDRKQITIALESINTQVYFI